MDIKYVFLGIIALLALFLFGNDPGSEMPDFTKDSFQQRVEQTLKDQESPGIFSGGVSKGFGLLGGGSSTPLGALPGQGQAQAYDPNAPKMDVNVPAYYLTDGRRIFFAPRRVFELKKNGMIEALNDGEYELQGGQKIYIREGMRVEK